MRFCVARFNCVGQFSGASKREASVSTGLHVFLCLFEKNNKTANVWKSYVLNKSFYDKKNTINVVDVVHRSVGYGIKHECKERRWC